MVGRLGRGTSTAMIVLAGTVVHGQRFIAEIYRVIM